MKCSDTLVKIIDLFGGTEGPSTHTVLLFMHFGDGEGRKRLNRPRWSVKLLICLLPFTSDGKLVKNNVPLLRSNGSNLESSVCRAMKGSTC